MRHHRTCAFVFATLLALGLAACGDTAGSVNPADAAPSDAGAQAASGDGGVLADPTAVAGARGGAGATGDGSKCAGTSCSKEACDEGACSKTDCCSKSEPAAEGPACVCAQGKAGSPVWCKRCDKGYVDGKEVCCSKCVDAALKKQGKDGTP